jgi:hypothetical protein
MRRLLAVAVLTSGITIASPAAAQTIIRPVAATINSGGPGAGSIADTYNGAGLSTNFVSGVTNFDAYIASGPTHTFVFQNTEWFSNPNTTAATVTYDLGSIFGIDRLALWNEEASGIGSLNLLGSTDGSAFTAFASGLLPTDHLGGAYAADVFAFAAQSVRYVRFEMSGCPQPNRQETYPGCAIGEVAFRTANVTIPEPSTYALLGSGLLAIGGVATRRRRAAR